MRASPDLRRPSISAIWMWPPTREQAEKTIFKQNDPAAAKISTMQRSTKSAIQQTREPTVFNDSDDKTVFVRSSLFRELSRRPSVTTMENKYFVSSSIAEFWCTVTSPAYAAPCIFWIFHDMTVSLHLVLSCCALTALFSTLYHTMLTKAKNVVCIHIGFE